MKLCQGSCPGSQCVCPVTAAHLSTTCDTGSGVAGAQLGGVWVSVCVCVCEVSVTPRAKHRVTYELQFIETRCRRHLLSPWQICLGAAHASLPLFVCDRVLTCKKVASIGVDRAALGCSGLICHTDLACHSHRLWFYCTSHTLNGTLSIQSACLL